MTSLKSFFISIPHSGEQIPEEASWLKALPEVVLMRDVDRYVDQLYLPVLNALEIPYVATDWHRYAVDLNRLAEDVDQDSVIGSANAPGSFTQGLHWVKTTQGETLMKTPISQATHKALVEKYFKPFHEQVREQFANFKSLGFKKVYHLDAHSMPSRGTSAHRDPGQDRADIVVSDFLGKSCGEDFKNLVINCFEQNGFKVAYNFPYIGGRVTQTYGLPHLGQESIQVELNRKLYMNEDTKMILPESKIISKKISNAIECIFNAIEGDQIKQVIN